MLETDLIGKVQCRDFEGRMRSVVSHVGRVRTTRSMAELLEDLTKAIAIGLLLGGLSEHGVERSMVAVVGVRRTHAGSAVVTNLMTNGAASAGVRSDGVGSAGAEGSGADLTRRQNTRWRHRARHAIEVVVIVLNLARNATAIRSVAD